MTCSIRRQCEPSIRRSGVTWTGIGTRPKVRRRRRYKACRRRRKHGVGTALRRAGGDRHGARSSRRRGQALAERHRHSRGARRRFLAHARSRPCRWLLPTPGGQASSRGSLRRKRLLSRQGGRCPLAGTSSAKRPPQNPEDLTIFHATGRVVSVRRLGAGRVQRCASSTLLPTA